jgi:hypothetical protein
MLSSDTLALTLISLVAVAPPVESLDRRCLMSAQELVQLLIRACEKDVSAIRV